jgi:hypothetical protein
MINIGCGTFLPSKVGNNSRRALAFVPGGCFAKKLPLLSTAFPRHERTQPITSITKLAPDNNPCISDCSLTRPYRASVPALAFAQASKERMLSQVRCFHTLVESPPLIILYEINRIITRLTYSRELRKRFIR